MSVGVLFGLVLVASLGQSVTAQDLVPDIDAVRGMEWYRGPEAGKDLLAKNGFVVTTRFYHRIFGPYLDKNLPHFVTADSVHRTYHVLFEEHLKEMERVIAGDAATLAAAMRAALEQQPLDVVAGGVLAEEAEAARMMAIAYFQVAEALLSAEESGEALPETAGAELALIASAAGVAHSPLFRRDVDYSQFKPRGFYTESPELRRYFRAMSWFGNGAFLLSSPRDTLAALMIARAMMDTPVARECWQHIDQVYTAFLGPCDDLTPVEYANRLSSLGLLASKEALASAMETLRVELRDPTINSMVLSPLQMADWAAASKGMRFMGKRYLPDSAIFMDLTDPAVPGRGFPTGLDIMAANGSARAAALIAGTREGTHPAYVAGAERAAARLAAIKADENTQYAAFLRVAETLHAPPEPNAAPFAKTAAYADKNLMTSLAAWASTRHAWMLHAKHSSMSRGASIDEPPPGYVEPNPAFFDAMKELASRTKLLFTNAGRVDLERFNSFESLLEDLGVIVGKELAGQSLNHRDLFIIQEYGFRIAALQGFHTNSRIDHAFPWMALVADVHTEHASGQCLEVATGGAMPIYVVLEHEGIPYLHVGGVYSYYEFIQPIGERLTDEEWRSQWDRGEAPAPPAWTSSFLAGVYDIPELIERLRQGKVVEGLEFIRDPALDAFLVECVLDAQNQLHIHSDYLFYEASRRAPEVVNPVLLEMATNGPIPEGRWDGDPRTTLGATAAAALTGNIRAEDVPALVETIARSDALRARHVAYALSGVDPSIAGDVLMKGLRRCDSDVVKLQLLELVRFRVAIETVPALLEYAESENELLRMKCLLTAGFLWENADYRAKKATRMNPDTTDSELRAWRQQTKVAITEELAQFDWEMYKQRRETLRREIEESEREQIKFHGQQGVYSERLRAEYRVLKFEHDLVEEIARVAGQMALAGAVPFLQKALERSDRAGIRAAAEALVEIGTNDAVDALRSALSVSVVGDVLRGAIDSVRKNGNDPDFQRRGHALVRLLEDRTEVPGANFRACDLVVSILTERGTAHSPGRSASNALDDRDTKAWEWVAYIEELQLIDAEVARERYWNEEY